jgi:hypothetical protein
VPSSSSSSSSPVEDSYSASPTAIQAALTQHESSQSKCAINLYGLPRAFEHHVLPSLVENVIKPNFHYRCDFYIHYFNKTSEGQGRSGIGGSIDSSSVLILKNVIQQIYLDNDNANLPTVEFVTDTESNFQLERKKHIDIITSNITNNPYTTGKNPEPTSTVINILKMWHSQTKVFELMAESGRIKQQGYGTPSVSSSSSQPQYYTRVAMLRLDVIYMTPIDIYKVSNDPVLPLSQKSVDERKGSSFWNPMKEPYLSTTNHNYFYDVNNHNVIIPGFASFPVNDRLIIGPYRAVQIWAAKRWNLYQQHVQYLLQNNITGVPYGLHDESFVGYTVLPTIENTLRYAVMMDRYMYFLRIRADGSIWILDSPYDGKVTEKAKLEKLFHRKCTNPYKIQNVIASGKWQMKCPVNIVV